MLFLLYDKHRIKVVDPVSLINNGLSWLFWSGKTGESLKSKEETSV